MNEAGGEFVIISYYNNKHKKQFVEITLKVWSDFPLPVILVFSNIISLVELRFYDG
jgi:hypothetical protein